MAVYLRGKYWYYSFSLDGERYRGSTEETDRDKAADFEEARKRDIATALMESDAKSPASLKANIRLFQERLLKAESFPPAYYWDTWLEVKAKSNSSIASSEFVYFIQMGDELGPVKIGMTADLDVRMRMLQIVSPYKLKLLALIPGGKSTEQALHRVFSDIRLEGEWFKGCVGIRKFAERLGIADHRRQINTAELAQRLAAAKLA